MKKCALILSAVIFIACFAGCGSLTLSQMGTIIPELPSGAVELYSRDFEGTNGTTVSYGGITPPESRGSLVIEIENLSGDIKGLSLEGSRRNGKDKHTYVAVQSGSKNQYIQSDSYSFDEGQSLQFNFKKLESFFGSVKLYFIPD